MSLDRLRRRVAFEAARLIYTHEESQFGQAKIKAARSFVSGRLNPGDLPCNREIRNCIQTIARTSRADQAHLLTAGHVDEALGRPVSANDSILDCYRTYELLLLPLESVMQSPEDHPEGDVLYHSLQVFELARQRLPYDEELLLAALLHDVGKAIDRRNHVAAGLEALDGVISPRTAWFIEHHVEALVLRDGELGIRPRRRLEAAEDFDELMLLSECDRQGRIVGMETADVYDALQYIRDLAEACGDATAI